MDQILLHKMPNRGNDFILNHKKSFTPYEPLKWETIQVAFDFAYNMTFGNRGEHRDHRSGGLHSRKPGEIFSDTFQGKLSECALYNVLFKKHKITLPSFEVWKLGKWDTDDFVIDGERASVKSTKAFGNLLLLEAGDFDTNGNYRPNLDEPSNGFYSYFILVRMKPFCVDLMRQNRLLYSTYADYNDLKKIITSETWFYDVPGYAIHEDIVQAISEHQLIHQGSTLNGRTRIDAENYYIQAGDLRDISSL